MINCIIKKLTGKEIVFVNYHRNSAPIINYNQDKYIFYDPGSLWKILGIVGKRKKMRYRLMYMLLSLVKPALIIDINWLDKLQSLYLVWANNHNKQFVVVQHGIYYGGMMRDIPEKYIKCNIMLVWSDYFRDMFLENNPQKDFLCLTFGNPVYNQYNREHIAYPSDIGNRVLLCPSLIKGNRLKRFYTLIEKLKKFGFDLVIKEHRFQSKLSEPLRGCKKTDGDEFHLYKLLESKEFDFVITDVSTAMTDIIFFKNRVIYFSPEFKRENYNNNIYGEYLQNLNDSIDDLRDREELLSFIDLESQEKLLARLVKVDHLSNDLNQINNIQENTHSQLRLCNLKEKRV